MVVVPPETKPMDSAKKARLEADGWKVGSAAEFLGASLALQALVDLRIKLTDAVCDLRQKAGISQIELASRLGWNRNSVYKIKARAPDVSCELLFLAFFELGGKLEDLLAPTPEE